jgi:hypothetical protein
VCVGSVYIYISALELTSNKKLSQTISLLFMAWPMEIIYSISYHREMPIQCFLIISFYNFVKYIKHKQKNNLVKALIFSVLGSILHAGMIGVFCTYVFIAVQMNRKKKINLFNPFKIFIFILVVFIFINSPIGNSMTRKFSGVDSVDSVVERTSSQRVRGNTAYVTSNPGNLIQLFMHTPYRMTMFALAPVPWQVYDAATATAFLLDSLFRLWIVHKLFKYFRRYKPKDNEQKIIKLTAFLIIMLSYFIFAWGTFTYGTAMRHRAKTFPVEIIVAYSVGKTGKIKGKVESLKAVKQS